MEIKVMEQDFSVCKIPDLSRVNFEDEFYFVGKTDEELSLVCITDHVPQNATHRDDCWRAFRIQGELDFSLIGVLSGISALLAENRISIFAISTYNTDYILTKAADFPKTLEILINAGYKIV